ncbi:solute carrier family 22 member 18 isoform X14 [Sagmatias obliquidens]|uniref:solute carrier family 22 member 18 isoform X14 n=1 Tax=Sagmatias obliquidens TaxID=3371155 RepID=UPI000F441079|nr:solute carrier family 22 member 18 isoform X14 [Lagenorhynchus obliquidens]
MGPRSHGEGLEMPRPASPSSPTGPLRAACLLPHDSAPLPSSAGLLPPALSSSLLFGSLRGLPATPAQDAGSQGLQGPGPVPQQDWHSGPVPGHAARVRAGSPGARLPLHAVLSHAIPVPEAGPGLCCLRLPADHLWRASAVGRARVWQRSTCSWLSPAARPCPACPYSLPRACPAPSCTRCQVGPAAQMAITDLSAPEERPAALGRLGLCFGVGVIFGSLLGGTLSSTCGIQCPVIVALVVSLLGAVLSFTCIPTSTKGASARAQAALPGKPKASVFDLKAITCLLLQPGVLPVFLVKVICGFPSGLFMVMFSLISMDFFQLEAAQAGYLMSFFGVLQMRRCRPACPPFGCCIHTLASGLFSSPCSRLPRLALSARPSARRSRLRGERGDSSAVEADEPLASHWETQRRPMVRRVSIWAPAVDRSGRGQTPVVGRVTRRMAGLCVPPACPPVA